MQYMGWLRITECFRDTLMGHLEQEAGGLGPFPNSAMNSFSALGLTILFSQASVFL